mmetsp:Transcript_24065/g.35483  ORF Transcript_24065/g.35483 Transcript_24065/m.35483 type:complete len:107 (-) Transcript_24065:244-564(-)
MALRVWSLALERGTYLFVFGWARSRGYEITTAEDPRQFKTVKLLPSSILLCTTWWPCLSDRTLLPLKTSTLFMAWQVRPSVPPHESSLASATTAKPLLIQDLAGFP